MTCPPTCFLQLFRGTCRGSDGRARRWTLTRCASPCLRIGPWLQNEASTSLNGGACWRQWSWRDCFRGREARGLMVALFLRSATHALRHTSSLLHSSSSTLPPSPLCLFHALQAGKVWAERRFVLCPPVHVCEGVEREEERQAQAGCHSCSSPPHLANVARTLPLLDLRMAQGRAYADHEATQKDGQQRTG